MSLKLDLAGAAAEASQQGLSGDLWKGGADGQTGAHDQVRDEQSITLKVPKLHMSHWSFSGASGCLLHLRAGFSN